MSKKNEILEEELKKFKLISEYDFYIPPTDKNIIDEDGEEDDEMPDDYEGELPDDSELDNTDMPPEGGNGEGLEGQPEELPQEEDPVDGEFGEEDDMVDDLPEPEGDINAPDNENMESEEEPVEDDGEIELDVSDLVNKSQEAMDSSEEANEKLNNLMGKFSELENSMSKMDMLSNKLEDLQKDVIKRNPSEVEKLEMRSFNSYPYNLKLTDYWNDAEDNYDIGDEGDEAVNKEDEEYVLTDDDVESDYSESDIRSSFSDED